MEELIDEEIFKKYSSDQKVELLFGLSKAYEDIKDFENSFKFLKQANLLENQNNIQKAFDHRAKMNGLSSKGEWSENLEKEAAA